MTSHPGKTQSARESAAFGDQDVFIRFAAVRYDTSAGGSAAFGLSFLQKPRRAEPR